MEQFGGSGIPTFHTTDVPGNNPRNHLSRCPRVNLGNNDSERTLEVCVRTSTVIT